jgi:hypothetical protein
LRTAFRAAGALSLTSDNSPKEQSWRILDSIMPGSLRVIMRIVVVAGSIRPTASAGGHQF